VVALTVDVRKWEGLRATTARVLAAWKQSQGEAVIAIIIEENDLLVAVVIGSSIVVDVLESV
jgi:hypothetical protein